jgi:hypothetical protein
MIEDIFNDLDITRTNIVVGLFGLFILWNLVSRLDEERRIAQMGKHASIIPSWLPYSKLPILPISRAHPPRRQRDSKPELS